MTLYAQVRSIFTSGLEFTRPGAVKDESIRCALQIIRVDDENAHSQIGEITLRADELGPNIKIGDRFDVKLDRPPITKE